MHKKVWSFILTVVLLLALTPENVMAASAERDRTLFREAAAQETQTQQTAEPETETRRPAAKKTDTAKPAVTLSSLEGSGTQTDPYRIKNGGELRVFADLVNGVSGTPNTGLCAVLTQNIDLSGVCSADAGSWTPIGTNANPYSGTFDGASFAVSGLYCQKSGASYAGLFASNAGVIRNLTVAGDTVSADSYAGGICGVNKGTITGCHSSASVSGNRYIGGICGCNEGGAAVSVCSHAGAVSGSKYAGGICGYNKNTVSDCYNTGTVTGSGTSIGGICGYNKLLVSDCYNTGEVAGGTNYVGSICGYNHSGSTFLNCYYLITGTEKGNYGVAMTAQQFASGEVCWDLNEGNGGSVVWRQTCGTGLPTFGGKTVYRSQTYRGDGSAVFAYTNSDNKRAAAPAPYTPPAADSSGESTNESSGEHTHVYSEPEWNWKRYESAKAVFTCEECGEEWILKASVKKETTEATCTEDGETVYTASVEKDGITYKDKRVVEKERTGHQSPLTHILPNATATCKEPVYTRECWTCEACGKYFADPDGKKELSKADVGYQKPLAHTYGNPPTWEWTPAVYPAVPSAAASFTCKNCNTPVTKKATVRSSQKTEPKGCDIAGSITYTATVTFEGITYSIPDTQKMTVEIPAKGHTLKRDPANPNQYICTTCKKTFGLNEVPSAPSGKDSPTRDAITAKEAPEDKTGMEQDNPEETPETPTPPEESAGTDKPDTPEAPDETGNTDVPDPSDGTGSTDVPDGSDGAGDTDVPDSSDGTGGADTPDTPDNSNGTGNTDVSDTPDVSNDSGSADVPDSTSGTGGADVPDTPDVSNDSGAADMPDAPDGSGNANTQEILDGTEEGNHPASDAIDESATAFRTTPAVNDAVQAAAKQQEIPLWGPAVLLTLLTGIVLLVILRKNHH